MITCEHFIYTTAPVKEKSTYQVTAKSDSISDITIRDILKYVFPTNADLTKFKESRSLILLNDEKIAYCKVRNIGVGYDGRDDTLYGHTILINSEDFKKIHYDSRILNEYYIENSSLVGKLEKIIVEPKEISINFRLFTNYLSVLPAILSSLFHKHKVALIGKDDVELIQEILAVLPQSLRNISFSTFLDSPEIQSKYQFVTIEKRFKRKLQDGFRIINPKSIDENNPPKKNKTIFEEGIEYLCNIIIFGEQDKLSQLNTNFEKIQHDNLKDKLILVTNCSKFSYAVDEKLKQEYADNILKIIKEFDRETRSDYFNKVKKYSKQYELLESKIQTVSDPNITLAEAFLLLPTKIMMDLYRSFLPNYDKNESS